MANGNIPNAVLENVQLIFRNFAGKEDQFNREGARNFAVKLDQTTADVMAMEGWNIKVLKAREDGEPDQPYLPVAVSYKIRPPRIVLITSRGRNFIHEDSVETLDWVDITNADLIVNPSAWAVGDKSGVKAYLESLYLTINEDPLERKYAEVLSPSNSDEER